MGICSFVGCSVFHFELCYLWCHQCVNNMSVMVVDNWFSVIHATAANFDGITIEYFSYLVVFKGVFVY